MAEPLVSLIVAVYQGEATLRACLNSLTAQTYPHKQIIVIDGGSRDGTTAILQAFAPQLSYWVSEPDEGIYDAWNKGLAQAQGEWIVFIGADDRYTHAGVLARMVEVADSAESLDFLSAQANTYYPDGRFHRVQGSAWNWPDYKLRLRPTIVHTGAMHHRRLFERYGPFDPKFRIAGDYDFLLRAGPYLRAAFLPEVTLERGAHGISHQQAWRAYKESYQAQRACSYIRPWEARFSLAIRVLKYRIGALKYRLQPPSGPSRLSSNGRIRA